MFIAIKECANGNETIGTTWLEAKQFGYTDTLQDVYQWASQVKHGAGRLIIVKEVG